MSYIFDGISVDGYREQDSKTSGASAGAISAFAMAALWCGISHWLYEDASIPARAIARTILGNPSHEDPLRVAVAVTLGLAIHISLGMLLGHILERASTKLRKGRAPRGGFIVASALLALILGAGLGRLAPAFAEAVPFGAFLAGHILFGMGLELKLAS